MNPKSFFKLMIATIVIFVVSVCVWVLTPDYSPSKYLGEKLAPKLLEKINEVSVFSIEHKGQIKTFLKNDNGWFLMESDEYPADKERIRNALIGIAGLEKVEQKTSLPEFYPDLQVEDNSENDSQSYLVTLLDEDGQDLLKLLVGKQTYGSAWNNQGYYVRFTDKAESWLVRGSADVTGASQTWLMTKILPFAMGEIKSVTIVDGTKKREAIYKRTSEFSKMEASFLSDGYFVISDDFIGKMETTLADFSFKDVQKRPEILANEVPFSSLFIESFDGLNAFVFLYLIDKKPYAAISFLSTSSASETIKQQALELEKHHSKWLYLMDTNQISSLLPFMAVPEKEKKK